MCTLRQTQAREAERSSLNKNEAIYLMYESKKLNREGLKDKFTFYIPF